LTQHHPTGGTMQRNKRRILAVATITALISGVGVAAFAVDDTKEVRQADFIPSLGAGSQGEADVRANGHYEFLEEGLRLQTTDSANPGSSQNKVAEYFAPRGGNDLPTSGSQDWYGTSPAPGMQIVFDTDADRANAGSYNILVGEAVYGNDWWLTGPGGDGQARAAANGYTCPQTSGGSGSNCHGTLAQWKTELETSKPNYEVYAYGASLGSGVLGDGVLRSQTYGGDEYIFTDEAEEVTAPTMVENPVPGSATWNNANRVARITMTSPEQPANDTGRGTKVKWEIFIAGTRYYVATDGWGSSTTWAYKFGTAGGSVKVELKRNGVSYGVRYITTN
ncbi:MAG: hypothetical protein ABWX73_00245, partial [Marmoricola sp.]